jgi:hypothetical protein
MLPHVGTRIGIVSCPGAQIRTASFPSIEQQRWRWAFVIEIVADSIRIEHLRGDELPANAAKMVTQSKFEAGIDPEAVGEGAKAGRLSPRSSLVSAGNQERTEV